MQIETFSSGEAFLNSPHLKWTRCLILDIRMPGMSGLELQQRLQWRGAAPGNTLCMGECGIKQNK